MNRSALIALLTLMTSFVAPSVAGAQPSPDNEAYPLAQRNVVPEFPVHGSLELASSFGSGWLAPGYASNPTWHLTLRPTLAVTSPAWGFLPAATLRTSFEVSSTLTPSPSTTLPSGYPRLSDSMNELALPRTVHEPFTNLSLTPSLLVELPLSTISRWYGQAAAVGGRLAAQWDTTRLPMPKLAGDFGAAVSPAALLNIYAPADPDVRCFDRSADPLERPAGRCFLPARWSVADLSLPLHLEWFLDGHSVVASLELSIAVRSFPAPDNPASATASPAPFGAPLTAGLLAYRYRLKLADLGLPFPIATSFSAGISSRQPAFNLATSMPRFPFWDFVTPSNNFSVAFLAVGIDA